MQLLHYVIRHTALSAVALGHGDGDAHDHAHLGRERQQRGVAAAPEDGDAHLQLAGQPAEPAVAGGEVVEEVRPAEHVDGDELCARLHGQARQALAALEYDDMLARRGNKDLCDAARHDEEVPRNAPAAVDDVVLAMHQPISQHLVGGAASRHPAHPLPQEGQIAHHVCRRAESEERFLRVIRRVPVGEVLFAEGTPQHGVERHDAVWMHRQDQLLLLSLRDGALAVRGGKVRAEVEDLEPQLPHAPPGAPLAHGQQHGDHHEGQHRVVSVAQPWSAPHKWDEQQRQVSREQERECEGCDGDPAEHPSSPLRKPQPSHGNAGVESGASWLNHRINLFFPFPNSIFWLSSFFLIPKRI